MAPSKEEVERHIREEAVKQGVDPDLAVAIGMQESRLDQSKVSPKGAVGIMQLRKKTAEALGVKAHEWKENVSGGVKLLKQLLHKYTDPRHAVAAYNAGEPAVDKHKGIPPFKETQTYVPEVMARMEHMKKMADPEYKPPAGTPTGSAAVLKAAKDVTGIGVKPPEGVSNEEVLNEWANENKVKKWSEVASTPEYQKMPEEMKAIQREAYFEDAFKGVPQAKRQVYRTEFENYANDVEVKAGRKPTGRTEPFLIKHAPTAGAIIGGLGGAALTPESGGIGAIPGTAAGAATGSLIQEGYRRSYNPALASPNAARAIEKVVADTAAQTAGEAIFRVPGMVGRAGIQALATPAAEGARGAQQALQETSAEIRPYLPRQPGLTLGQASDRSAAHVIDEIARSNIFSKGIYEKLDKANMMTLGKMRQDIYEELTKLPRQTVQEDTGQILQRTLEKGDRAFQIWATNEYAALDREIAKAMRTRLVQGFGRMTPKQDIVDISSLKNQVVRQVIEMRDRGTEPPTSMLQFLRTPNRLTFSQAIEKRSDLLKESRDLSRSTTETAAGNKRVVDTLQSQLRGAMEASAKRIPAVWNKYQEVTAAYERGVNTIRSDTITKIAETQPSAIVSYIKSQPIEATRNVKNALEYAHRLDPRIDIETAMGNVRAAWLEAELSKTGAISVEKGQKANALWMAINAEPNAAKFREIFTPQQQESIKRMSDALVLSQKNENKWIYWGARGLSHIPTLGGGGALLFFEGKEHPELATIGALGLALSPLVLAKAMTNPVIVNKFLKLSVAPPASEEGARMVKSLAGDLIPLGAKIWGGPMLERTVQEKVTSRQPVSTP